MARMVTEIAAASFYLRAAHGFRQFAFADDDVPWPILDGIEPLGCRLNTVPPERAQAMFIRRWVELGGGR